MSGEERERVWSTTSSCLERAEAMWGGRAICVSSAEKRIEEFQLLTSL